MKYLDTNVIIYAVENHPKYGKASAHVLTDVVEGRLKVAGSVLVLLELVGGLRKINKELQKRGRQPIDVRANIDAVLSLPITWLELEIFLIKRAAEYSYPVSAADCAHAASMEVNGIREIISADQDFDKIDFVKRIDPLDY